MKHVMAALLATVLIAGCAASHVEKTPSMNMQQTGLSNSQPHEVLLRTTSNAKIRQGYVDTELGQLHYWEAGSGPALLLFHQAASSGEEYAGLVDELADKYRLIAFDWPGHGMSDDPAEELLVDDFSASGLAVLDHLNVPKAHVLGHHGGALVAMNMAWKHPTRVDRLILSGTSGVKDMEAVQEFSEDLGLNKLHQTDREGESLSAAWDRFTGYMPQSTPGEILRPFLNTVTVRIRPYDSHYGVLKFDRRPALDSLKDRRILLMQAENDPFVSDQDILLGILPKSERVVVKDAGVFVFFEQPETTAAAIAEFLEKP